MAHWRSESSVGSFAFSPRNPLRGQCGSGIEVEGYPWATAPGGYYAGTV
jgi:hypothetical protein